jgi:hypothetical protein
VTWSEVTKLDVLAMHDMNKRENMQELTDHLHSQVSGAAKWYCTASELDLNAPEQSSSPYRKIKRCSDWYSCTKLELYKDFSLMFLLLKFSTLSTGIIWKECSSPTYYIQTAVSYVSNTFRQQDTPCHWTQNIQSWRDFKKLVLSMPSSVFFLTLFTGE